MGKELLHGLSERQYARLHEVRSKRWGMLNATCSRIVELTLDETK
jgi:hypothetical protein